MKLAAEELAISLVSMDPEPTRSLRKDRLPRGKEVSFVERTDTTRVQRHSASGCSEGTVHRICDKQFF
jgi:hypothetical protein